MTAKELRLKDEGIQVTGFEAPRRMDPETARQQCTCGVLCYSDCPQSCDTDCDSECMNLCVWDEAQVAKYIANPKALVRTSANGRVNTSYKAGELY